MRLEYEAGEASIKNAYLQSLLAAVAAKLTHVSPHPTGEARPGPLPCLSLSTGTRLRD